MQKRNKSKSALRDDGNHDTRSERRKREKRYEDTKPHERKRRRSKTHYDGGISGDLFYVLMMTAAIIAAVGFAVTVFFKVSDIEVTGTSHCLTSEIRGASGINEGDKLFFLNRFKIAQNIFSEIPYVDEIRLKQVPPGKVILEVTERIPLASILCGNVYYIIDENCRLLEYYPVTQPSPYPTIVGISVTSPELGNTINLVDEIHLVSLREIMSTLMTDKDIVSKITEINMEKLYDVYFMYDGRFKVNLGDAEGIANKTLLFKDMLDKLEKTDKGIISLKNSEFLTFLPN